VHEDLDQLLDAKFIILIRLTKLLSPIVIVPKNNGKIRICVDYRRVNSLTKKYPYPFIFIDEVLDSEASKELHSFLDGFSGYKHVKIRAEDREKINLIINWGVLVFMVMPFKLCTVPTTFQCAITKAFGEYIGKFM
jgi:hypothetical protein